MKTSPASVHFRAKPEFSLSCNNFSVMRERRLCHETYKAISRMNTCAPVHLSGFDDFIAI